MKFDIILRVSRFAYTRSYIQFRININFYRPYIGKNQFSLPNICPIFAFFLDKKKAANCETWSGRKRNCFKKFKTAESKRRKHNYRCCSFSLKTYISINTHRPIVRIEVGILLSICGFHTSQTKKTASLSASRTKKKKHWFWRCHKTKISSHLQ